MRAQIILRTEGDEFDLKNLAPFLGRDFQSEIACGHLWDKHPKFLTKEEEEILYAPNFESYDEEQVKLLDPKQLKKILEKVLSFLKSEEKTLPFEVEIDFEKMNQLGLETDLYVDGVRCWIQGDSKIYKVDKKVKLINLPQEKTVEKWLEIKEKVQINDRVYYLKIETRYERHEENITKCIDFCQQAIEQEKKIYWLYEH